MLIESAGSAIILVADLSSVSRLLLSAMPADRGRSAVEAALEKAAKLAARQALMDAAENIALLQYGEVYSDDLRDLLPWSTGVSCTQVTYSPPSSK